MTHETRYAAALCGWIALVSCLAPECASLSEDAAAEASTAVTIHVADASEGITAVACEVTVSVRGPEGETTTITSSLPSGPAPTASHADAR